MKECSECDFTALEMDIIFDRDICENCKKELEEKIEDGEICPECGSENIRFEKSYEYADADGNRGKWIRYLVCNECGYYD